MTYRNKQLLEVVRGIPCTQCGADDGTVVAAHSNQLRDGKGRSIKSADYRIAALCYRCHTELDSGHSLSYDERIEKWESAHRKTIGELFERGYIGITNRRGS